MKILFYKWHAYNEACMERALRAEGHEGVPFAMECRHYTRDLQLSMQMIGKIHAEHVDAVFSFNYYPIVSLICDTCKIPYYAWVFDAVHFTLFCEPVRLACNHIASFDRHQIELLSAYGVDTVFYLPLAGEEFPSLKEAQMQEEAQAKVRTAPQNARKSSPVQGREPYGGRERFASDVSFVGTLYTGAYSYYTDAAREKSLPIAEEIIEKQKFCYDADVIAPAMPELLRAPEYEVFREYMETAHMKQDAEYFLPERRIVQSSFLEKEVTIRERQELLRAVARAARGSAKKSALSNVGFDFALYTGSDVSAMPELSACARGVVDYDTEMPFVFALSRINLSMTRCSIRSGIPLRVFDVMACGGFVLTDARPDIEEFFTDGKELAIYHGVEECLDKIAYYLSHEEERLAIARAGRERVARDFTYAGQIKKLFAS